MSFVIRHSSLALALALVLGCKPGASKPAATLELPIYFTGDVHGRLVPCGCFSGQFGGLTRLKSVLDAEASDAALRVDVGDAIAGHEDFHVLEYRQILRAFRVMKFEALNLGQREAQLSAAQLRELKDTLAAPFVSANVVDRATRRPVVEPYRLLQRGGFTIAVVGVVDPRGLAESLGDGIAVEPMEPVLTRLLPEVRTKADLVVLLAFTDESTLAKLAQEFYELDVILGGKVRQPSQKLEQENRSLILYTTNESRALGLLRLRLARGARPVPLEGEIRLLHDRIPQDASIRELATAYREEVRRVKLDVDSPRHLEESAIPGVRVTSTYVGSDACLTCHPTAAKHWTQSGHARAFATLAADKADADPKCIGCHTVGFGSASGYRRADAGGRLAGVGCESCHGPGSLHVRQQNGDATVNFRFRPLGAGDCQKCHYGEFSRPFDWNEFWPPVRHGKEGT